MKRAILYDHLRSAWKSVRTNKSRAILTVTGIVVGVVSVVSIVSLGEGVKQQVRDQINHVGKDLLTVRPGKAESYGGIKGLGASLEPVPSGSLSPTEVRIIAKTSGVALSAPLSVVSGQVAGGDHSAGDVAIVGTTDKFVDAMRAHITYGGNFDTDNPYASTALVGSRVAERMFDDAVPLGRSLTIRGQEFHVAGILDDISVSPFSVDVDFNDAIYIPYDTAQRLADNNLTTYEVLVRPDSPADTDAVITRLTDNLAKHHGGQHDFSVMTHAESAAATNEILNLLTTLVGGVAIISLIVGGVGIMNIMLVSVAERMHEIGIRKAVGATNRQILEQFMMESAVLSLAGGLLGVALAYLINLALRLTTELQPVISWQVVVASLILSLLVGIVFGSAPALKAARKDPISALRNE
jgi:ABC-type antimicrobial peptide transport system permease subunit